MGRKRILKIPKTAMIKCPFCNHRSRIKIHSGDGIYFLECKKCKRRIETPATQCCLICAFSNKKCAYSLKMEAKRKGLEIRAG